jgi:hypothetical protein
MPRRTRLPIVQRNFLQQLGTDDLANLFALFCQLLCWLLPSQHFVADCFRFGVLPIQSSVILLLNGDGNIPILRIAFDFFEEGFVMSVLLRPSRPQQRESHINNIRIYAGIDNSRIGVREMVVLVSDREASTRRCEELNSAAEIEGEIELRRIRRRNLACEIEKSDAAIGERLDFLVPEIHLESERIRPRTVHLPGRILQHLLVDDVIRRWLRFERHRNRVCRVLEGERPSRTYKSGILQIQQKQVTMERSTFQNERVR